MLTYTQLMKVIEKKVKLYPNQAVAAKAMGVSPQYLGDVLAGRRDPGAKILSAVGYARIVLFEKIP